MLEKLQRRGGQRSKKAFKRLKRRLLPDTFSTPTVTLQDKDALSNSIRDCIELLCLRRTKPDYFVLLIAPVFFLNQAEEVLLPETDLISKHLSCLHFKNNQNYVISNYLLRTGGVS